MGNRIIVESEIYTKLTFLDCVPGFCFVISQYLFPVILGKHLPQRVAHLLYSERVKGRGYISQGKWYLPSSQV